MREGLECHYYLFLKKTVAMTRYVFLRALSGSAGTAVAQWLRCCATNRKVAGSIPDGVIGIFN